MTSEGGFKNNRRSFPRESVQCARLRQSQSWHRLRRGSSHHDCQVQQWIVFMSSISTIQYIQLMLPKHKHLPKRNLYVIQAEQPSGNVLAPGQWGCRFMLYTLFHAHLAVQEAHAISQSHVSQMGAAALLIITKCRLGSTLQATHPTALCSTSTTFHQM